MGGLGGRFSRRRREKFGVLGAPQAPPEADFGRRRRPKHTKNAIKKKRRRKFLGVFGRQILGGKVDKVDKEADFWARKKQL